MLVTFCTSSGVAHHDYLIKMNITYFKDGKAEPGNFAFGHLKSRISNQFRINFGVVMDFSIDAYSKFELKIHICYYASLLRRIANKLSIPQQWLTDFIFSQEVTYVTNDVNGVKPNSLASCITSYMSLTSCMTSLGDMHDVTGVMHDVTGVLHDVTGVMHDVTAVTNDVTAVTNDVTSRHLYHHITGKKRRLPSPTTNEEFTLSVFTNVHDDDIYRCL